MQKNSDFGVLCRKMNGKMNTKYFFFFFVLFLSQTAAAQRQVCSTGVLNMQQLRILAQPSTNKFRFFYRGVRPLGKITPILYKDTALPASAIFLPQWTAADLPVFCRIEHEIGKKMPLLIKFRLGSVEYVDWLEGKN
jgi:hypothetical protein